MLFALTAKVKAERSRELLYIESDLESPMGYTLRVHIYYSLTPELERNIARARPIQIRSDRPLSKGSNSHWKK